MKNIEMETLTLQSFDKENKEHLEFFKKLVKQPSITSRFQGIGVGLLHEHGDKFFDRGFLITDNDKLIGYLGIGEFDEENKSVYLRGAIDIDCRGNSYGKKMLKESTEYIFLNYPKVENIRLKIAEDNIISIRTAEACGYEKLYNDFYIHYNPYIEKKPNQYGKVG